MIIKFRSAQPLTAEEKAAASSYYVSSSHLHAVAQGWSTEFQDSRSFVDFIRQCPGMAAKLDSAIAKYEITTGGTVYSGHGYGLSVVGSLTSSPERYKGFTFRYPGYTSTSVDRLAAENFMRISPITLIDGLASTAMDGRTG